MRNWETIDWAELFARLHPVLLHLPIGLFVALAWLQCWSRYSRPAPGQPDLRTPLIWLLLISTLLSATSGWLLHEGGGYPAIVEWHEWGGIGLTAVAIGITVTHLRKSPWYPRLVWVGFFLLLPTYLRCYASRQSQTICPRTYKPRNKMSGWSPRAGNRRKTRRRTARGSPGARNDRQSGCPERNRGCSR